MVNLMVREIIESLYIGICDVVEYQKVKDPVTKKTGFQEVTVLQKQPCKLSYGGSQKVTGSDNVSSKDETIKLFLSPDVEIKEGSKIIVSQHGRTQEYSNSSVPAVFSNHQEITLELFKGWS